MDANAYRQQLMQQLASLDAQHNPGLGSPSALVSQPSVAQMAGNPAKGPAFVQMPIYPTSPFVPTAAEVGFQMLYFSTRLSSSDTDYAINSEAIRTVTFDLPVRIVAINGASIVGETPALLTTQNMNQVYGVRLSYTNGNKVFLNSTIASTVVGTMERPGQLGGTGVPVDTGASIQVGLTPYIADLQIDIVLVCLQMRSVRNFVTGG